MIPIEDIDLMLKEVMLAGYAVTSPPFPTITNDGKWYGKVIRTIGPPREPYGWVHWSEEPFIYPSSKNRTAGTYIELSGVIDEQGSSILQRVGTVEKLAKLIKEKLGHEDA